MSNIIELESSYILDENHDNILAKIKEFGYELDYHIIEEDTYFTDKDENFIKDRICLRTRKTNNDMLELTYKPKTDNTTEKYGKKEINISLNVNDYDDIKHIINELGYVEYVSFRKDRTVYTKLKNDFTYNVMLDRIESIGNYIELEIIAHTEEEKESLASELDKLVSDFECENLQEKKLPYRDIVKQNLTNK